MMVDEMADERATVLENDFVKLHDFLKNPFNTVRDLEKQIIELNDDDVPQLKSELEVKPEYREKFNELLDSLIDIEIDVDGNKHYYFKALQPFVVSPKNNKSYPNNWVIIDGNSRYYILTQLINLVGEDNVDFTISYKIYKDWQETATLLSAPGMGYNSNIPVLKQSAETTLNTSYDFILSHPEMLDENQTCMDWIKQNIVASAKKDGVNKNIFGWWKVVQDNPHWHVISHLMNSEVAYLLIKYEAELASNPDFLTFTGLEGEKAKEKAFEMLKQEITDYVENTRGRLTTKKHVGDIKSNIEAIIGTSDTFLDPETGTITEIESGTESEEPHKKQPKIDITALAESSDKSPENLLEDLLSECLDGVITTQSTKWQAYDELEMSEVYGDLLTVKKILNKIHKKLSPEQPKAEQDTEQAA